MPVPSMPVKAARRLLRDEAADLLRAAILDGTFAPGEVLEETALTEWIGVSRSPVRDALLRLQLEGLVVVAPQSGTHVATATPEEFERDRHAVGSVFGAVLRSSAERLDEDARRQIIADSAAVIDAAAVRDIASLMDAVLKVHESVLVGCSNPVLVDLARLSLGPFTFRYRALLPWQMPEWNRLAAGWETFQDAMTNADAAVAALAFENLHTVALPA